jgi:hypothetical protein
VRLDRHPERFIQSLLREWAHARFYRGSNQRNKALRPWLRYYDTERPHSPADTGPNLQTKEGVMANLHVRNT